MEAWSLGTMAEVIYDRKALAQGKVRVAGHDEICNLPSVVGLCSLHLRPENTGNIGPGLHPTTPRDLAVKGSGCRAAVPFERPAEE